jgi:release factor glutamine methyltransferase
MHQVSGFELWQWRQQACEQAEHADVSTIEVDWLLQEVAALDRLALRLESFKTWETVQLNCSISELEDLWHRRLRARVPIQYLLGVAPWRQFSLQVAPGVLIPRPETEELIDLVQSAIAQMPPEFSQGHWVDLGTGSGAIAIGLADALPQATIHAVDISATALAIARSNAETLGFGSRIYFYQGDWFEPLITLKGHISGMVSNPPYIPTALIATLQPEVAWHEPQLALDGGRNGLECIQHLIAQAPDYLKSGGFWAVEMMMDQAATVTQRLAAQGSYQQIRVHRDLAGIDRFASARRR